MDYLFELSKEDIELSRTELSRLVGSSEITHLEDVSIVSSPPEFVLGRPALTKAIYQVIFETPVSNLIYAFKSQNWKEIIKGSFAFRSDIKGEDIPQTEAQLGGLVFDLMKTARVDLKNPDTLIQLFVRGTKVVCGVLVSKTSTDILDRRAHLRPHNHPSSLDPRLAKAGINLTGLEKGVILDPFCGTGGILIEAGLMGFRIKGYDILDEMVEMCRENLEHYGITDRRVINKDALKGTLSCDAIVTDIPYGKNTVSSTSTQELFDNFIAHAAGKGVKKIVIMTPDTVDTSSASDSYEIVAGFTQYIHKSLSKKITVLDLK